VLVFGSSRAKQHILPSVLASSVSSTVFNAGVNGQEFLCAVMLLDLWKERHNAPRVIVLHVDPGSFTRVEDEIQKTSVFSAHYDQNPRVREIISMRGKYERVKYLSYAYRFNGKVLPILKNLAKSPQASFDGYEPLAGPSDLSGWDPELANPRETREPFLDVKLRYFDEIVKWCRANGTRLFLVHSPYWKSDAAAMEVWLSRLSALLAAYPDVEFINISEQTHAAIFSRPELFRDGAHLNPAGSRIYSGLLAAELSRRLDSRASADHTAQAFHGEATPGGMQ
jgi:hypothetical protein